MSSKSAAEIVQATTAYNVLRHQTHRQADYKRDLSTLNYAQFVPGNNITYKRHSFFRSVTFKQFGKKNLSSESIFFSSDPRIKKKQKLFKIVKFLPTYLLVLNFS